MILIVSKLNRSQLYREEIMANKVIDFGRDTVDTATSGNDTRGGTFGASTGVSVTEPKDETRIGPKSGNGFRTIT